MRKHYVPTFEQFIAESYERLTDIQMKYGSELTASLEQSRADMVEDLKEMGFPEAESEPLGDLIDMYIDAVADACVKGERDCPMLDALINADYITVDGTGKYPVDTNDNSSIIAMLLLDYAHEDRIEYALNDIKRTLTRTNSSGEEIY